MFRKFVWRIFAFLIPLATLLFIYAAWPFAIICFEKSEFQRAQQELKLLGAAIQLYKKDFGYYPDDDIGLNALVDSQTPYISELPNDPWGKPYGFKRLGPEIGVVIWTLGTAGESDDSVLYSILYDEGKATIRVSPSSE